jgi:hypothetical protein
MGTTSSTVNYACLYVGLLKVRQLLSHYNLLFFKRFIDDWIGVWIDTPDEAPSLDKLILLSQ